MKDGVVAAALNHEDNGDTIRVATGEMQGALMNASWAMLLTLDNPSSNSFYMKEEKNV